jgi:hypothetical protein
MLNFYGWQRSGLFDLANRATGESHLRVRLDLALQQRVDSPSGPAPAEKVQPVDLRILGPGDVSSIQQHSFASTAPVPGAQDVETTKRAYVEMAATDLPWRFTPETRNGNVLRPWIVLVVGTADEITLLPNNQVRLEAAILNAHKLSASARWAHVQEDLNARASTSRLLSPRGALFPNTEYLAVVVPAFDKNGGDSWPEFNSASLTLPYYFQWRFRTGEAGDFVSLAKQLKPGFADPELGRAPLDFGLSRLIIRGALAPLGSSDDALPPEAAQSINQLRTPRLDERNRQVIGLPIYGGPWVADPDGTAWGAHINTDPRHRGVAGLGLRAGIQLQEMIASAAAEQTGALDTASQRIRNLTIGLQAARSLWNRRLPNNPMHRLLIYADAMRRIMTNSGSVLDQIAGEARPLPPGIFSTAARRIFRRGTALSKFAGAGATDPANLLRVANTCPVAPVANPPGMPHADSASRALLLNPNSKTFPILNDEIREALNRRALPHISLLQRLRQFVNSLPPGSDDRATFASASLVVEESSRLSQGIPHKSLIDMFNAIDRGDMVTAKNIAVNIGEQIDDPDDASLLSLGAKLLTQPPNRPCNPVDLNRLEQGLSKAIDPTAAEPFVQKRVLSTIDGLGDEPLAPPEVCIGLDLPVWSFLRDSAPDWLLPGLEGLAEHSVVAMESNPVFVEAFLLGLNMQALNELRWRNIPIATGCTPLRMFWGQFNAASLSREPDIRAIETWSSASELGDHQSLASTGKDLVIVFRSDLFRRYPHTLVYAIQAISGGVSPIWTSDPDDNVPPVMPTFQGSIGEDITVFCFDLDPAVARGYWIVLEELPAGYSFRNDIDPPDSVTDGGEFAAKAFSNPLRVLIRGDKLIM